MIRLLVLVTTEDVLDLVYNGLVGVVVLLTGELVLDRLAGGLLAVWDNITSDVVGSARDTVGDLVEGGLGVLWGCLTFVSMIRVESGNNEPSG